MFVIIKQDKSGTHIHFLYQTFGRCTHPVRQVLSYPNVIFEISLATGYRGEGIGDLVEILLGSQMSK